MVIAFVQPHRVEAVLQALHGVDGLTGATITHGKGFGRADSASRPDSEDIFGTADRVRIEVAIRDALEDRVVHTIRDAAHTGRRGDGKIYVLPIARAVRIDTGADGEAAI